MTRLARHQPRNVLPPDDHSTATRLTAELEAAGYEVMHVLTSGAVHVVLDDYEGSAAPPFTAPTYVEALRKAHAFALGGGS